MAHGPCAPSGQYGESALRDVLPVDLTGISADGPRAFSTDSFKPRLTAAGRSHPVISLSLDAKASGESLDLKAYEADMRHLLDTYIEADEPRKNLTLWQTSNGDLAVAETIPWLPGHSRWRPAGANS